MQDQNRKHATKSSVDYPSSIHTTTNERKEPILSLHYERNNRTPKHKNVNSAN